MKVKTQLKNFTKAKKLKWEEELNKNGIRKTNQSSKLNNKKTRNGLQRK